METRVAHSDRREAPAPLGDRTGFGGAGVTETLSTGPAVVLGVVGLKVFLAFMTLLQQTTKENEQLVLQPDITQQRQAALHTC